MKLSTLKANPTNPRIIKDEKFQKLVKSIEEFPEMLEARPIVVNPEMIVIGGNMRFKACKAAGVPVILHTVVGGKHGGSEFYDASRMEIVRCFLKDHLSQ